MPILKAPPKLIRNATIQVRVEEEIDLKLRKYAEYIGSHAGICRRRVTQTAVSTRTPNSVNGLHITKTNPGLTES